MTLTNAQMQAVITGGGSVHWPPDNSGTLIGTIAGLPSDAAIAAYFAANPTLVPILADSSIAFDAASKTLSVSHVVQTSAPVSAGHKRVLRRFHAALANRASAPVDIVVVGDSVAEGQVATTPANRWVEKVLTGLRATYSVSGVAGGLGYQKGRYAAAGFTPRLVATGGQNAFGSGLGANARFLSSGADSFSMTIQGTRFDIFYTRASSTASFNYAVSGATTIGATLVTATGTGGASLSGNRISVNLTRGVNTLSLTWVSGTMVVEGVMVYDQDEAAGIRLWESGHGGYDTGTSSSGFLQSGSTSTWFQTFAPIQPALVIIALGINDYNYAGNGTRGNPSVAFATNLQTIIANIRAQCTIAPSILLMPMHQTGVPGGAPTPVRLVSDPFANYVNAMYAIAAADGNIGVIDYWERTGGTNGSTLSDLVTYGMLNVDNIHPNDAGHQMIADAVINAIVP